MELKKKTKGLKENNQGEQGPQGLPEQFKENKLTLLEKMSNFTS